MGRYGVSRLVEVLGGRRAGVGMRAVGTWGLMFAGALGVGGVGGQVGAGRP